MNVLVFDIETIPDVELGRRSFGLEGLADAQVAKAMFNRGFRLGALERFDEALAKLATVEERFGGSTVPAIMEICEQARALRDTAIGYLRDEQDG